jgi:hypothetical protein
MDSLRTPLFVLSLVLAFLVVGVELGGGLAISGSMVGNVCRQLPDDADIDPDDCDPDEVNDLKEDVPGLAIPALALLDGMLLFSLAMMAAPLLITDAVQGRIQGIVTLIVAILILLAAIAVILVALGKLLLMVGLFLAVPFGTIAYFAIYAAFPKGAAAGVLGGLMLLKLGVAITLVLAQQRFLQMKSLVFLILTTLLANVIVGFLHGLVPGFLVSITDAVAAIVVGIIAVIWSLVLLIGSIPAVVKAIV